MKKHLSIILALAAMGTGFICHKTVDVTDSLHELVNAERQFAALTRERGISEAFSACLAEEAVGFRPEPVRIRNRYVENPEIPGRLIRNPEIADVAASGDLGYMSGSYEFYGNESEPADHGHYVSVWEKQAGVWKVVLDVGVRTPGPGSLDTVMVLEEGYRAPRIAGSVEREQEHLMNRDRDFSSLALIMGMEDAYANLAMDSFRFYREGRFPARNLSELSRVIHDSSRRIRLDPLKAAAATFCDLGYSYGTGRIGSVDSEKRISYLHIWKRSRRGSAWKLVLVLHLPVFSEEE
ncbi:MAG TPA: nuclear transport factor 2 family protein [bacterium]|nr:nuclear transport factor 2 family protein [bacterium]